MRTGRPPKITPAVEKKIAECFFDGFTDSETALLCDISTKTIQKARHTDLFPRIKKIELNRKQFYIGKIRDGDNRDWPRIAWWLERRWPTEFTKPEVQLQINTTNQTVTNTLIVTADIPHGLNSKLNEHFKEIERLKALITELCDALEKSDPFDWHAAYILIEHAREATTPK
jgi:hypothetical protein